MKEALYKSIFIISLSMLIAFSSGLFSYKKLDLPLKIMFYYTCISILLGSCISAMSLKDINNIFLINTYTLIEFGLISSAYYFAFNFKKRAFLILHIVTICLVLGIYTLQTFKDPNLYNNALNAVVSIIMVIASVGYLIVKFHNGELEGDKKPFILLSVGTFMYFASSFLIVFIGSDNSLLSDIQVLWIYFIHSIFYLIFVIILSFAFLICMKQSGHSNLY
jgi:hypothetical protein